MHPSMNRVLQWANGGRGGPFRLEIELTNLCNLRCSFCWQQDPEVLARARINEELPREKWLSLVRESADLGVRYWQVAGAGEPLARQDVALDLMMAIKEYSMEGFLITNGTMLDDKACKELVSVGWDTIEFSIDGPDGETHDGLRGIKGAFDRAMAAVSALRRERRAQRRAKPRLQITAVITNRMHRRIPEMVAMCNAHGIEKLSLNPLIVCSPAGERLRLDAAQEQELQVALRAAETPARETGLDNNFRDLIATGLVENTGKMTEVIKEQTVTPVGLHPFLQAACYSAFHVMEIRPDGKIGPCCIHHGESDNLRHKSLAEVWFGHYLNDFRAKSLRGELPSFCRNCAAGLVVENRLVREQLSECLK